MTSLSMCIMLRNMHNGDKRDHAREPAMPQNQHVTDALLGKRPRRGPRNIGVAMGLLLRDGRFVASNMAIRTRAAQSMR
jgi:hypothetical protein